MIKQVIVKWCNACGKEQFWVILEIEPRIEIQTCWKCFQAKCLMYAHTELKGETRVLECKEIPS